MSAWKFLNALMATAAFGFAAYAQTKTVDVYSNGAKVYSIETDAQSIWMRGDGYKDLGTFSTSGGTTPPPTPPTGAGVNKIIPGANITVSPSTGIGDVTISGQPAGTPIPGAKGDKGDTGATGAAGSQGIQGIQGIQGVPGTGGGGAVTGLPVITTQAAFVAAVNDAFANCYVAVFDGRSKFQITSSTTFNVKDCGQVPTGFNGNGMAITSTVNDGQGVLKFVTTSANRSLVLQGFAIFGDSYSGKNAGTCVTLQAEKNKAFYKFTIRDVWLDYCSGNGLDLIGDIFEGGVWNLQAENSNGSGLYMNHGADCGIISNIFVWGLNASRNHRYGMELATRQGCGGVSSVHAYGPSMVSNGLGGILATGGVRNVEGGNCENSGPVCVDIQDSPYQSRVVGMEMSTDNNTRDPQAAGGGSPAKYAIRYPTSIEAKVKQYDNSVACYAWATGVTCAGVQVRAP